MATTVDDFRARFPEFSDTVEYPTARIQIFLDDATCDLGDGSNWCSTCKFDRALCYYTAHLLTVATRSEAGDTSSSVGPISSKSAGGVSVTRAVMTKDRSDGDDWLASTAYGMQYIQIRNGCLVGVTVANCL